jgi:hypothetical protein
MTRGLDPFFDDEKFELSSDDDDSSTRRRMTMKERERKRERGLCLEGVRDERRGAKVFFFFTPLLFCLALLLFFGDKLMMDHVLCITVGNKNKKIKIGK